MVKLVILRGLPDSNKDEIVKTQFPDFKHLETDMFFTLNGNYFYDKKRVGTAHAWCQKEVIKCLQEDKNVIVTNTFVMRWEITPYLLMSHDFGTEIEVITATGKGDNKTNVPQEIIDRMRAAWEDFNLEEALLHLG